MEAKQPAGEVGAGLPQGRGQAPKGAGFLPMVEAPMLRAAPRLILPNAMVVAYAVDPLP